MTYLKYFLLLLFICFFASESHAVDKAKLRWMRKKPPIDSIVINGAEQISKGEIKGRMYSRKRNFFRELKKDRRIRLQRETLNRDTLEIKYLYMTKGFLAVRVNETFYILPEDSSAMVWVNIHEGRKFVYGNKSLYGTYDKTFQGSLAKIMNRLEDGKPANPIKIQQVVFDMKTEFANRGYPYAKVDYTVDTSTSSSVADIVFNVKSDSLVHFGKVNIEGMKNYPINVGRRELKVKEGSIYRRKDIIDSQKRLFESGYFTFSQLNQVEPIKDRLKPDFTLKVVERKKWFTTITAGAGQSEFKDLIWDFNFGIGKRDVNFTKLKTSHGSHRISAYADYSFTIPFELFTHRYRLRYTTPWTFGIRMPLSLTLGWEPKIQSQLGDYKIRQWNFSAITQKWYGSQIYTTAGLEYDNVKYSDFGEGVDSVDVLNNISIRRKLFMTFRMDSRDNIFIPRVGQLTYINAEINGGFLGGEDSFYKIEGAWSTYQPVWPGWIYAVRLKGGIAKPFGDSQVVPLEERLYLGGANTIRGFAENSLGPQLIDTTADGIISSAKGANYTIIINQEFRWKTIQVLNAIPLFGIGGFFKSFPQWQSIFFDAGNGFDKASKINLREFAFSYGAGYQIMSPAGPIRIDYARRIKTDRYDVDSRWHFTILYAF